MKICAACQTENDDTRVICMECGDRLPTSQPGSTAKVPKASVGASAPPITAPTYKKKPIPKRAPNAPGRLLRVLFNLIFLAIIAAFIFAAQLAWQAPDGIRPPVETKPPGSETLLAFFKKASATPGGAWMASEESINSFLTENVRPAPLNVPFGIQIQYRRCFVELEEGRLDFVMEQSLSDYPLYFSLNLVPYSEGGELKVRFSGASFGRLPIPEQLTPFLLGLWRPCFDSLGEIVDTLDSASSASVTPKSLLVRWPGKGES